MSKGSKTVKAAGYMMAITLIGKVMGLMREQLLGRNYALGMEASAFMTASQIPRVFFDAIFASAISASFIPIFNEYLESKGKEEAFRLSNNFITIITILTFVMTAVCMLFAPQITMLFADGFNEPTAKLCTELLICLLPTIIFTGIAFSLVGILQSLDEFGIPAAMSIASNGIVIIYFLFFNKRFGVFGLTVAFLIGWAMQAIIQVPALIKKGYRYRFYINLKDEGLQKIFKLMLPVMVGTWIQPINLSINLKYASRLFGGDGSGVSAINYANTLYTIIISVFVLSVANVIFPQLSRLTTNDKKEEFGEILNNTIRVLLFIVFPMMFGLMSLSEPIISLIYQYGRFDEASTIITSRALFFFSLGMIGFGIQTILSRACYAVKDGRTPLISGILSIAANLILCVLLYEKYNVVGLALASSFSTTVAAIVLIVSMRKKIDGLINSNMLKDLLKILSASFVMVAIVVFTKKWIIGILGDSILDRALIVGVPTIIGVCIYMFLTYFMKVHEARYVFDTAIGLIKRK